MPHEPLTPEEREALREEAAERIIETAGLLQALIEKRRKGEPASEETPAVRDPARRLMEANERRLAAEASLLKELLELVLPESRLLARPIRSDFAPQSPEEDPAPLEALFGSLPARYRQAEWLELPALPLHSERELLGAFTDAREGDTGASLARVYWALMDGRLVEAHLVGTWKVSAGQLKPTGQTLVGTRVVEALDVVRAVSGLADIALHLRHALHEDYKVLEGKHVPDLAERQARFDALLEDYQKLVVAQAEGLRRVGDSPA